MPESKNTKNTVDTLWSRLSFLKINPHFQSGRTKLDAYEATDASAATGLFLLPDSEPSCASCRFDCHCATHRVAPLKSRAGRALFNAKGCRGFRLQVRNTDFFKVSVRIKGTVSSLSSLPAAETLRQQNVRGQKNNNKNLKRGIQKARAWLWVQPRIIPRWVYRSQMPSSLFFFFLS